MQEIAPEDAVERVVIAVSKAKLVRVTAIAVVFAVLCAWLWSVAESQDRFDPLFARGVAVLGLLFSCGCAAVGIRKLGDSRPGLILDSTGLTDNTSALAAGHVPWSEVRGLDVTSVGREKFLTIHVEDPERYLEHASLLKRGLCAANMRLTGSPIHLTARTLAIDFETLTCSVQDYYQRYGQEG